MARIANALEQLVDPLPVLRRGWARRPPNGQMYGAKYIRLYEEVGTWSKR